MPLGDTVLIGSASQPGPRGTSDRVLAGLRVGDRVPVSGTTAIDEAGDPVAPGEPAAQTPLALATAVAAVESAGGARKHVVRTRLYVTGVDDWATIGEVHGEFFGDGRPAATMVELSGLIGPEYVVEIEAEAGLPDGDEEGTWW